MIAVFVGPVSKSDNVIESQWDSKIRRFSETVPRKFQNIIGTENVLSMDVLSIDVSYTTNVTPLII